MTPDEFLDQLIAESFSLSEFEKISLTYSIAAEPVPRGSSNALQGIFRRRVSKECVVDGRYLAVGSYFSWNIRCSPWEITYDS